jgi:hemoglobin-like flavoprotein
MTPEQVVLVQSSFAQLRPEGPELARRFYQRLFEVAPAFGALFSVDPAVQARVFESELAVIVDSLPNFDVFISRTRRLGATHGTLGVTYVHYETMGLVLLEVLAEVLGPAFTEEMSDAWRLGFDLMAETMMQGAADATPTSGGR